MAIKYSLRQFEVFVAVASTGSFTAAAEQLHTSRAALTATIDALEEVLGELVFNRRRSFGITLTPAGERLLPGAISLLHDAQRLTQGPKRRSELTGELVVGATVSLASTVLPVLMQHLSLAHPRLRVRVIVRGADELLMLLKQGGLELLFSYAASTPVQRVRTQALFDARFGVVAPSGRFDAGSRSLPAAELRSLPLVILDNLLSRQRLFEYFNSVGVGDVEVRYRVGSLPLCLELVRMRLACAVVPILPQLDHTLPPGVECFDLDPSPEPIAATVAWNEEVSLSLAAEAALGALRELDGAWAS